jgi:prepilin-type N-terminal cleavage/methylation domain-containing protein
MSVQIFKDRTQGFTLAELLIALAILGVIATFAIPKVLQSQQSNQKKALAKEVAAIFSASYQAYLSKNDAFIGQNPSSLLPYLNYVSLHTSTLTLDDLGQVTCGQTGYEICLKLHSGSVLVMETQAANSFSSLSSTGPSRMWVGIDPDGKYTGPNTEPMLWLGISPNGRLITYGVLVDNPALDPSWFTWN